MLFSSVSGRLLGATVLAVVLMSCSADKINVPPLATCDTTGITYGGVIKPILQTNCYSCHNKNVYVNSGNGFNMEDFDELKLRAESGLLLDVLYWRSSVVRNMPDNGNQLPNCEIRKIERWVTNGTPNN